MLTGHHWGLFGAAFLASMVEWVEAYTVVLAVALAVGWRRAGGAAITALLTVSLLIVVTGGALHFGLELRWLRLVIGILLLLFGLRWLAKAVARASGRIALHNEAEEFHETNEALSKADQHTSWLIAYKGVLLEGMEVWLIIVALGYDKGQFLSVGFAALLGLLTVIGMGFLIRKPLTKVPENAIKFIVGSALLSFGTFWTAESLGGPQVWPLADWSILILFGINAGSGLVMSRVLALKSQNLHWEDA